MTVPRARCVLFCLVAILQPGVACEPPPACRKMMNDWCNNPGNCPNPLCAGCATKVALNDTNVGGGRSQYRCYDPSTLDGSNSSYVTGKNYCTRDAQLRNVLAHCLDPSVPTPAPPTPPSPPEFLSQVFIAGEAGIPCIRIPSIIMAGEDAAAPLLAFAECRYGTGDGCEPHSAKTTDAAGTGGTDNAAGSQNQSARAHTRAVPHRGGAAKRTEYVCMKRSLDGGASWSKITFPFGRDAISAQPTAVYDAVRGTVVLQNIMNGSNFQVVSRDAGQTWGRPTDIGSFLGRFRGVATGPGRGLQLLHPTSSARGRLLFIGHHGAYIEDAVWYSDDGGLSYTLSNSTFPKMDEAQLVELSDGSVMANMRNNHYLPGDCRGVAVSNATGGYGTSFGSIRPDPALISPVCMASIISNKNALFFSNPATTVGRTHMTVRSSLDDGRTWSRSQLVYAGPAAYSCLTRVPQGHGKYVGLLWETESHNCDGPSCRMLFSLLNATLMH